MKKTLLSALVILNLIWCAPVFAEQDDPVMKALQDETDRSMKLLHLDSHALPYFVSFEVKEVDQRSCFSILGSPAVIQHLRERILEPIVKIGSHNFDSSFPSVDRHGHYAYITSDDDYNAVRRAAWKEADQCYKYAITGLEWKKAYLVQNNVPDRLPDWTKEKATVSIDPKETISIDEQKWCKIVEQLSAIFKNYPTLQKSKVILIVRRVTRWYVNSEGTRIRDSRPLISLNIWATAQAPDGMPVSDHDVVAALDEKSMPDYDHLKNITENLAKRVSDLRLAPKADEYCGPVLLEGQGAAEFFSQLMAPNFDLAEEYLASNDHWRNPLKKLVGHKIMPKFISVVDDPQATEFKGTSLIGGYKFDDEGIPGEKLELVDNGVLKGFCQSRVPTKHSAKSNGHSQGGLGVHSIINVSSSKSASPEELKGRIQELATEAGLDYILVIPRLCVCKGYFFAEDPFESPIGDGVRHYDCPDYSAQPTDPIVAYRLYLKDGHRELVRGLEFTETSLRAFRDIDCTLDDAQAYLVEPDDHNTRHLITPSYLVRELVLTQAKSENTAPPQLPGPLALQADVQKAQPDK